MIHKKILISACLLGKRVRYDGNTLTVTDQKLQDWISKGWVASVCPEVDAGMSIPRVPAEISNDDGHQVLLGEANVRTKTGDDVTAFFLKGARIALDLCLKHNVKVAVLSESSPSCGSSTIYDGRFSATKIEGVGVTTALLQNNGIQVFNQFDLLKAFEEAEK
jgi:uncharacterized protein YbbK (DUF523 family)